MTDRIAILACAATGTLVAMSLDDELWGVLMSGFFGLGIAVLAARIERILERGKG